MEASLSVSLEWSICKTGSYVDLAGDYAGPSNIGEGTSADPSVKVKADGKEEEDYSWFYYNPGGHFNFRFKLVNMPVRCYD
jgi:hypothetical protein